MSAGNKNKEMDDQSIKNQIDTLNIDDLIIGKRLRHEIMKPMNLPDTGRKNYYQMLKCFDYDPSPPDVKTPQAVLNKNKNENRY
jgi:hypothetical protein